MLLLSNKLLNTPVLSLRSSGQIAITLSYIINPNNLKIEGIYCHDRVQKDNLVLLNQDIRNIINKGIIINDHDVLSTPDILVRLKDIIKLNFNLIGKPVVTQNKEKVGKVRDFAFDSDTFYIQKIYVGQSIIKNLNSGQLSIDRDQIVEITDKKVIIQELIKPSKVKISATIPTSVEPTV
jgi:uncharacterized protein YrrD